MVLHNPSQVKKSSKRKHHESLKRPSKKGQHQRLEPPANSKKGCVELRDDISLKKLFKARKREKKRINVNVGGGCRAAEVEMERLCETIDRLERMKQKLLKLQNDKANNNSDKHHLEENVIYVSVAKLREKA